MTARRGTRGLRGASVAIAAAVLAAGAGCTSTFEVPIDTPIQAKLDVTPFSRVHVVGFISGGSEDVDANMETVRLLRSQLRTKSRLRVIEADPLPLQQVARDQARGPATPGAAAGPAAADAPGGMAFPDTILDEKDLEAYAPLFANAAYWRRIGEEYQNPLIVTGTVLFVPHSRAGWVSRDVEQYDSFGRRRVVPMRTYLDRKGFVLAPKFVFIDGRTGAQLYSEAFHEEALYQDNQNTPPLSSYFELMDKLLPGFLNTLSTQKIKGTRILLK